MSTEPDAYRDVDGRVFLNCTKTWRPGVYDATSTATPLWLTEAPDPVVIAAVLDRHRHWPDFADGCRAPCGWKPDSVDFAANQWRTHVAAAVCAALGHDDGTGE